MRNQLRAVLALLLGACFIPAQADPQPGFTISATGMYVVTADSKTSGIDDEGDRYRETTKFDGGFGGLLGVGYQMNPALRGEVELGYRRGNIDEATRRFTEFEPIRVSDVDATVSSLSLMANGIFTLDAGPVRPYLGAGLGIARLKSSWDAQTVTVSTGGELADVELASSSDDDVVFAYQAMAGLGVPVAEGIELRAGYRYFATTDADFDGDDFSYATHNFEGGVLFRF